jgi:uncharacterized membrane protein
MKVLSIIVVALAIFCSCKKDKATPLVVEQECGTVSFTQQIQPLIMEKCSACHSQNYLCGALDDYTSVKTKADEGKLTDRIEKKEMPPANPLSEHEIQLIKCWVNAGAQNN